MNKEKNVTEKSENQESIKKNEEPKLITIPSQYEGMPGEAVEELWQNPVYVDELKNVSEIERRQNALDEIKKKESEREVGKNDLLVERYANLSDEQKSIFPEAQKDASKILHGYIRGESNLESLSSEESFVIDKLRDAYKDFKKENPDKAFSFDFSKDIDRSIYNNLIQRLAFKSLEDNQAISDQEKANAARQELGIAFQEIKQTSEQENKNNETLNIEERKKLTGWNASFELAKVAETQGIDLSKLSREDYVDFAIDNSLAIDDDQLRMAPWQRVITSLERLLIERKKKKSEIEGSNEDKEFAKFENETKNKASNQDRYITEGVRVRSGTKDSNSWLFFGINDGINEQSSETYKSYISFHDIKVLTPDRFKLFMEELQKSNYNGDIKTFQDLAGQGVVLNDQVVMHGRSRADAELALQVAENFFKDDLDQRSLGRDEVVDGKNMSYSQILADKIKKEISKK